MNPVAPAGTRDESRRRIAGNRWLAAPGKERRPRIDQPGKIRPGRDLGEWVPGLVIVLIELGPLECGGGGQFGTGGKADNTDLVRIETPVFGVGAHELDRLQGVVHAVGLGLVAVAAQAVADDNGTHAVMGEKLDERGGFTDIQRFVASASGENDRRAGVELAVAPMKFDGRIVNVNDGS